MCDRDILRWLKKKTPHDVWHSASWQLVVTMVTVLAPLITMTSADYADDQDEDENEKEWRWKWHCDDNVDNNCCICDILHWSLHIKYDPQGVQCLAVIQNSVQEHISREDALVAQQDGRATRQEPVPYD